MTLDEFLRDLDLDKLRKSLLNPDTMNSTNYNEEDAVNAVARQKRAKGGSVSVMNAALPSNLLEERKKASI